MNYNSLRNKPTINYKELIGDNTVSEVGGITEEEFNTLMNTDLASYYTKAQIDELFARSYVYREKSGSIVTFNCPASVNGIDKVVSDIVAVQSGTGDPSPTNIRPISGFSAVNRYRTGKNFIPITCDTQTKQGVNYTVYKNEEGAVIRIHAEGTATANHSFSFVEGYSASNPFMIKAGSYWFKGLSDGVSGQYDLNIRKQGESSDIVQRTNKISLELSDDTYFQSCYLYVYSGTTINTDIYPMVWLKSEPNDDFVPYNGHTYTTTLKDENDQPLTCYGGQLVNENGVQTLVLTHGYIASYNGETLPSTWISDRDVYAEGTTPTTGAEVVYELATPQTIPQDNLAIASSAGINNIWCDSGDITVKALDRIIQG